MEDPVLTSAGKKTGSKSLSDLLHNIAETPFLTPVASPPYFTPPLTPSSSSLSSSDNHILKGCFHPLHESESDAVFNKLRSSPPPKLKFLRDAEDKLYAKKIHGRRSGTWSKSLIRRGVSSLKRFRCTSYTYSSSVPIIES
ncbi:uncharacterized protein LOC111401018 [Olea europaea subsp. europaea]|uniref:Uncharacterized protein LOC111401018 n=1 Tax=Olea europaea subsp. europaea TaxID=158383 RepID=A0A8S0Q0V7_OLEEU|nr:uncharacterized protein LOC111401018 [Olea europaea subsp. europaea]